MSPTFLNLWCNVLLRSLGAWHCGEVDIATTCSASILTWVLVQVLGAPLPVQLPAGVPGKAEENGLSHQPQPTHHVGDPGLSLAPLWLLRPFAE